MIWIDGPVWKKAGGREVYAHMVADDVEELHEFARSIGLGRHFYHSAAKLKHYDVSSKHYQNAVDAGAVVVLGKKKIS